MKDDADKKAKRIRSKIKRNVWKSDRARLTVFRSNKYIYAQIIDDQKGATIVSASEKDLGKTSEARVKRAELVGEILAKKALEKGIKKIVFDRGSYRFHGRVEALAEGARKGGLIF